MLSYENRPGMAPPTPPNSDLDHHSISSSTKPSAMSNGVHMNGAQLPTEYRHIWLITGPAGCGKSTVAQFVANSMDLPYIEGDDYHPQSNIDKMAHGIPLDDMDRWGWLEKLRDEAVSRLDSGDQGVVLTCSALKRRYRDVIRTANYFNHDVRIHFVYLHASEEVLLARVGARKGHYMGANMVHSQLNILEPPSEKESDCISVDVSGAAEQVQTEALDKIQMAIRETSR